VLDTCRDLYGGKKGMWGLPLNSDAGLLFYRSGQAKPASWDDYYGSRAKAALARARTDPAVPDGLQAADAGQFADEEILTVSALEAIWAAGGQVVNKDGKLVLNEDNSAVVFDNNAREGLKKLAAAYEDRQLTLPNAASADEDTAVTAFRDGKTLFMRNWPVAYDKLRTSSGNAGIPFEVAPLPGASVLGGQNLAISKWTDKPRAAQAFIEYLTNPASQLILFEIGASPRPGTPRTRAYPWRPARTDRIFGTPWSAPAADRSHRITSPSVRSSAKVSFAPCATGVSSNPTSRRGWRRP
jgi:multiple sugar transport system substrate-binding protein